MLKMFWFGLLIVAALLFSLSGYVDADADENSADTGKVSNIDDTNSKQEKDPPEENVKILYQEKLMLPPPSDDVFEVFHEELVQQELKINPLPREPEFEKQPELDHELSQKEAVEHMEQVVEDSKYEIPEGEDAQGVHELTDEAENGVPVEHLQVNKDDVLEGHYIGRRDSAGGDEADDIFEKMTADDKLKEEDADEKKRREALNNVELLRRSDRRQAEPVENQTKSKRRVFVKAFPPEGDFKISEIHEVEEKEHDVHEVVFINGDSHAHVVHKSKDYPRLLRQHDEM